MKSKFQISFLKNSGSTLVILVIAISIIIALGISLLSVSMMHFRIKKTNTEIKKAFYMAETGINRAYIDAYDLVMEAVTDSVEKSEEYLLIYPLNSIDAANLFEDNYKVYITGQIANRIKKNSNPYVAVSNAETLFFIDDKLIISIKSKQISENKVEKTISTDLIILVPDYYLMNSIDLSMLLSFNNWKIAR